MGGSSVVSAVVMPSIRLDGMKASISHFAARTGVTGARTALLPTCPTAAAGVSHSASAQHTVNTSRTT